jgi:hypothetical protein
VRTFFIVIQLYFVSTPATLHPEASRRSYYRWSKDFLEAGKRCLAGDTVREANTDFSFDFHDLEYVKEEAADVE